MQQYERIVWDASALIALASMADAHHRAAHEVSESHGQAAWIFPAIAWFEFQAAMSRLERVERRKSQRELYILDHKNFVFPIDLDFTRRVAEAGLAKRFNELTGADLVYACVSALMDAPLLTFDRKLRAAAGLTILPP